MTDAPFGGLPPYPGTCKSEDYPPAGGDGSGKGSCDDWPPVGDVTIDGCTCPPDKYAYGNRKGYLFFNLLPFIGPAINAGIGPVPDCTQAFADSANVYADAQTEFVQATSEARQDFTTVVDILQDIWKPAGRDDKATGILPTAVAVAMRPAISTIVYLKIIGIAIFLVLVGVVFTL